MRTLGREGFDPTAIRQAVGEHLAEAPVRAGESDYRFTNDDLDQLRARLSR